jgi:ABC-2 type transport system permease protein
VNIRLYAEVARLSFRRFSVYRGAMFAGTFTNTVFGFIRAAVLRDSIGASSVAGLTATSATQLVFLGQAMIAITMLFGDYSLIALVKSGDVATELHRPWDWSVYRLASDLGRSAYHAMTRGVLIAVIGWLAFRLPVPQLGNVAWFAVTATLAAVLASRIWTMAGLSAFWLVEATGVMQVGVALATFSTGLLVPLQLFPDRFADVLYVLPFASLLQGPIEVLLGIRSPLLVIGLQLMWIAGAECLLRWELRAALRKLEVQGG